MTQLKRMRNKQNAIQASRHDGNAAVSKLGAFHDTDVNLAGLVTKPLAATIVL
jgi:hypothetical protein